MIANERFERIVALTDERGYISTKELSEIMNVTETTIRRDSLELEKQGLIIRVHGGTKSIHKEEMMTTKDELSMHERTSETEEKDQVASLAASYINEGDCIFLDGGTSIVPILKYIRNKHVKVVTHSSLIIDQLSESDTVELLTLGGKYIPKYNMSVGPLAMDQLEHFNFDHAFISCLGVNTDKHIVYTAETETSAIKQKAMELSSHHYLLIDHTKLYKRGFYGLINSDEFDQVLCNNHESLNKEELPNNYILVKE